jgi:hypothetical protein
MFQVFRNYILSLVIGASLSVAYSDQQQMNETLVRLINQIDSMMPLVQKAELQQPKGQRFEFHFSQFEGSDGERHNGLKEDLFEIRQALIDQINNPSVDPYHITALNNDFVSK